MPVQLRPEVRDCNTQAYADAVYARWDQAVASLRSQLRTTPGQLLVDALAAPVLATTPFGGAHREGPVPEVAVLRTVLARLGEQADDGTLRELVDVDALIVPRDDHRPLAAPSAGERATPASAPVVTSADAPALSVLLPLAGDPAHEHVRRELDAAAAVLHDTGFAFSLTRALSSVRWWPTRDLPWVIARHVDPLSLVTLFRSNESRMTAEAYHLTGHVDRVARGEGVPDLDPEDWILAALAYRAGTLAPR